MTSEQRFNKEIEENCSPQFLANVQNSFGSLWTREYVCGDNDLKKDYILYVGIKTKFPTWERFGFLPENRSKVRRAFRFDSYSAAYSLGIINNICKPLQDEEE